MKAFLSALGLALVLAMPARAQDTDGAADVRWVAAELGESSLLPQVEAVYRALRLRFGLSPDAVTVDTVQVDPPGEQPSEPKGGCRFMEVPGSRIREERCYYPSESEIALNRYQFQEEIRFIREQQDILAMERAMIEEELKAYRAAQAGQ